EERHRRRLQLRVGDGHRRDHARGLRSAGMTTVAVQRQARRRRSPLAGYLLRRVGTSLLLLVGVTIVTFALTNLVPGDPVSAALGEGASQNPATREAFIREHGLDQPLFVQYFIYMGNLLRGDLGTSLVT